MKDNPAMPGGPLTSKPTWLNTFKCSTTSAFFMRDCARSLQPQGANRMDKTNATMARQLAHAASDFEQKRTGRIPKSVTAVLCNETLVITLHGALTLAEKAVAESPASAAKLQEYHQQLFANSFDSLRQDIERITGVEVREANSEIKTITGPVMQIFATGAIVQVFLLARSLPADSWNGIMPNGQP